MQSTIHAAHRRGHLSRHERQDWPGRGVLATCGDGRGSRGSGELEEDELDLIDRLVRCDRTAVSSALLAVAGIGAGEPIRGAVLAQVSEAACRAQAAGAISPAWAAQIARHINRALGGPDHALAA